MEIKILRIVEGQKQTLGELQVIEKGQVVFRCNTLELPNKHNQQNISSIPTGVYEGDRSFSVNNLDCIKIKEVPGRTHIQIHAGNFHTDIEGCILVGSHFTDINKDGYYDVANSRVTLNKLLSFCPKGRFPVVIKKKLV